jgi:hypothetical protein
MFTTNAYLRQYHSLNACNAACVLATCATAGHQSLRASAARLADASSCFAAQHQHQGDNHWGLLSRNAEAMATSAHDLDCAVSRGYICGEIENEYHRVTDNYQQLSSLLANENYAELHQRMLAEFDRITTAYRSTEAAMTRHAGNSRHAGQFLYSPFLLRNTAESSDLTDVA